MKRRLSGLSNQSSRSPVVGYVRNRCLSPRRTKAIERRNTFRFFMVARSEEMGKSNYQTGTIRNWSFDGREFSHVMER